MDFYRRVEIVCGRIPRGRVASYGQIALLCGAPGRARQVGFALSKRVGNRVPAHRVVNRKGILTGAGAFETAVTQKRLLESEGVEAEGVSVQRVDLERYGWRHTLEEALELRELYKRLNI